MAHFVAGEQKRGKDRVHHPFRDHPWQMRVSQRSYHFQIVPPGRPVLYGMASCVCWGRGGIQHPNFQSLTEGSFCDSTVQTWNRSRGARWGEWKREMQPGLGKNPMWGMPKESVASTRKEGPPQCLCPGKMFQRHFRNCQDCSSHKLRCLEMQNSFKDLPRKNLFREESWSALWAPNYRICFLVFSLKVCEGALQLFLKQNPVWLIWTINLDDVYARLVLTTWYTDLGIWYWNFKRQPKSSAVHKPEFCHQPS